MIDLSALLKLRDAIDEVLASAGQQAPQVVKAERSRFMTIPAFATAAGLSSRTIREYCELGMPHRGDGRGRRVLVADAEKWMDAGGPRKARAERKGRAA